MSLTPMHAPHAPAHYALFDPLRGVASLLVVLHHLPGQPLGRWAGELGVMLFFVISGYCIAAAWHRAALRAGEQRSAMRTVGTFMLRRLRRIFPPWWAALLLWCAFAGAERVVSIPPSIWSLNASLLHWVQLTQQATPSGAASANPISIMGIAWTLCYEEQYYLVMTLLLTVCAWASTKWTNAVGVRQACGVFLASCVVLSIVWLYAFPQRATGIIFDYLPHFGVGLLLYLRLCVLTPRYRLIGTGAIVAACAAALSVHLLRYPDVPFLADSVRRSRLASRELVAATTFGVMFLVIRPLNAPWQALLARAGVLGFAARTLQALGTISYSLYLVHTIPAHAIESWSASLAASLRLSASSASVMHITLQISLQLLLATIFYWLVERHFAPQAKAQSQRG